MSMRIRKEKVVSFVSVLYSNQKVLVSSIILVWLMLIVGLGLLIFYTVQHSGVSEIDCQKSCSYGMELFDSYDLNGNRVCICNSQNVAEIKQLTAYKTIKEVGWRD